MFGLRKKPNIESERMTLRLPVHADFRAWAELREMSATHLIPWEPVRAEDHLSRKAFTNRVYWAGRADAQGTALPLMMMRRADNMLLGAITLDNIRRGPVQAGTLGYWIGAPFARQGYMREAIQAVVHQQVAVAAKVLPVAIGAVDSKRPERGRKVHQFLHLYQRLLRFESAVGRVVGAVALAVFHQAGVQVFKIPVHRHGGGD